MKRILALLVLVTLVSTPALAYAQQATETDRAEDDGKVVVLEVDADHLKDAAIKAAHDVVAASERMATTPQQVPGRAGPGWRTATGIAMLIGGAAIIWKGVDIYQDEPDRFGRTKNSDAFLAYGVGGGIMGFGFLTLKGGLEGRGF